MTYIKRCSGCGEPVYMDEKPECPAMCFRCQRKATHFANKRKLVNKRLSKMKKSLILLAIIMFGCDAPQETVTGHGVIIQTRHREDKHSYKARFENRLVIKFVYGQPQPLHLGDTIVIRSLNTTTHEN